ncbi:MAG: 2,4-dihydroxyhept-2-ene-1,7-dioic acid aldolase, partial [Chloroflexi bacterium]|nr:2,4-dihydroxyhept-2-ene-1,7-dioic acid aldolase [Chloroflexota bacterium]
MFRPNVLRRLLEQGQPSLCVRVNSIWPDMVEMVGALGLYDYVEFAAEYGTFDLAGLDNFCRAAELYGMGTMIKLDQDPRLFLAQRAIGAGFQSVLFVDCRNRAEVEQCVRICRPDTPADGGLYGAASRRFAYASSGRDEFSQALRDVVVAIMVEKRALVDDLENCLVPGVDLVQWGPSDYAMSSGLQPGDPAIREAERHVIETCLRRGVTPRIELESLDNVEYYLQLGVRHFRIGTDVGILRR